MPSVSTVIKFKIVIITITLLVGIFILSYLSGVDSKSNCLIKYLISEEDYIFDEPDWINPKFDFFTELIKKESNMIAQVSVEFNDFFSIYISLFTPRTDILTRTIIGPSENGFCSIFYYCILSTDNISSYGQPSFNCCKSQ